MEESGEVRRFPGRNQHYLHQFHASQFTYRLSLLRSPCRCTRHLCVNQRQSSSLSTDAILSWGHGGFSKQTASWFPVAPIQGIVCLAPTVTLVPIKEEWPRSKHWKQVLDLHDLKWGIKLFNPYTMEIINTAMPTSQGLENRQFKILNGKVKIAYDHNYSWKCLNIIHKV